MLTQLHSPWYDRRTLYYQPTDACTGCQAMNMIQPNSVYELLGKLYVCLRSQIYQTKEALEVCSDVFHASHDRHVKS